MSLCKLHRIVLEMVRMFVSMRLHSKVTITIPSFAAKTKNAPKGAFCLIWINSTVSDRLLRILLKYS